MAKAQPITGLDSQAPTFKNARIILQERLSEMYAYAQYVDSPDNTRELHDLRIAAKRVRYTLELFEEFLPEAGKEIAEELAKLQDELGALHDSEVMLVLLRQLLQPEGEETKASTAEKPAGDQPALLSPGLTSSVLHPERSSALSEKERHGLMSFLQRQEQRRTQAYLTFRQHWEQLEQRHFYEEILALLNT